MPTFLELLTTCVLQINNNDLNTLIEAINCLNAPVPRDSMIWGYMTQSEYIAIAQNVKNFMDTQGKAPEYAYNTSLGTYFGYQNLIYTYSKILNTYNTTGTLPTTIQVKAWSVVSNPNLASFTPAQIVNAATWVKNYIETNHQLPTTVTINGKAISMPSFLGLITAAVLQIDNGDLINFIDAVNYGSAPTPRDSMTAGDMPKNEFIAIAQNVRNFMDKQGKAPEYAYCTSLGFYFGYQNMIYSYSKILDTYNTTGTLPTTTQIRSWRYISDPNAASFTPTQIINAATWVKNYIETNHQLPATVEINGINISMPIFLELLTTTVLQINNNDLFTLIDSVSYGNAPNPKDTIIWGYMQKSEYIAIAQNVKNFMDTQGKAPEYAYGTSLGLFFSYQNLIYTYSKILDTYNTTGTLPTTIQVEAWKITCNSNLKTFTTAQITSAATEVKNYIETNYKLPTTVTINGQILSMPTFLELLTTAVLQINNNDLINLIDSVNCGNAPTPRDSMTAGNMPKNEYLSIAQNIKNFMQNTGKAPEYAYSTSLGTYFGYQNLIYTYSKILDTYNTTGTLPTSIQIRSWRYISDPNAASFTPTQIINAATWVKNYIETNHQLPTTVNINGKAIIMPTFLELLTTTVLQINNNDLITLIDSVSYGNAPNPKDTMISGEMPLSEYISIAQNVKNFMDVQGKAPEYAYSTSLGLYFSYHNMIYSYSKILDSYNITETLPVTIQIRSWRFISDPNAAIFTTEQIITAATWTKNYIETNHQLPPSVTINDGIDLIGSSVSRDVSMPSFLALLVNSLLQIYSGSSTTVEYIAFATAPNPKDSIHTGNIPQSEYIAIAQNIKNFMDTQGKAPEYAYGTSLGRYFGYQNLIYTYSKILDNYGASNPQLLPDTVDMKLWKLVINQALRPVYITSDNIFGTSYDLARMNDIASLLQNWGISATVFGLGSNTHFSVLTSGSVPSNAVVVNLYGGACAGTIYEMGGSYYFSIKGNRRVYTIFISPTSIDIRGLAWLPRSSDDTFSPAWFTGLAYPDQFLNNLGYNFMVTSKNNILEMVNGIYEEAVMY